MSTTRRNILVGSAAALLPAAALAAPAAHPDAELIAIDAAAVPLIALYHGCYAEFFAMDSGDPDLERVSEKGDAPYEAIEDLTERAVALRATTIEGAVAKARLLHFWECMENAHCGVADFSEYLPEDQMAWSLSGDLLAMRLS